MATEEQVRKNLEQVPVPGSGRNLVELNLLRGITVSDQSIRVTLASTAISPEVQDLVKANVGDAIEDLPGVKALIG